MEIKQKSLRILIGFLAILLPVILILGNKLFCPLIQGSISDYYNTQMRTPFVMIMGLCCGFLFCYNGYDKKDSIITKLAATFGVILTLFPTSNKMNECSVIQDYVRPEFVQYIHLSAAALFFALLGYMSAFQFTKGCNETKKKKIRNIIYMCSGYIIFACLLTLFVYCMYIGGDNTNDIPVILILETVMLFFFGTSWLVKGGLILND